MAFFIIFKGLSLKIKNKFFGSWESNFLTVEKYLIFPVSVKINIAIMSNKEFKVNELVRNHTCKIDESIVKFY